jgi:hypothetical protein
MKAASAPAAEYVAVASLRPWAKNPRKNDPAVKAVADSIKRFGFGAPLIARRENGEIIAGHTRLKAAIKLGLTEVPVRYLDLSEAEAHALALADNKVGELAEWDDVALADVLRDLTADDVSMDGLGFTAEEIAALIGGGDDPSDTPAPGAPEVEEGPAHSVTWEVYELGPHRLACGDSYDPVLAAKLLGSVRPSLLMTDPPYGIDASKMTMGSGQSDKARSDRLSSVAQWDAARPDMAPFMTTTEWQCVWGGNYFADTLPPTNHWLCWHKKNDGLSFSEFELAWTNYGRQARHLSHHWSGEVKEHITQKPLPVIVWALQQCPDENAGAAVYDPFGGSGTTLLACAVTGRVAYLSELSPHYCDVIRRRWTRWAKEAGQEPGTGALNG